MAITTATRFNNIIVYYVLGLNIVDYIEVSPVGQSSFILNFPDGGADPDMGTDDAAALAVLRAINATADGFRDADGNPTSFEFFPWELGWDSTADIVAPWANPFITNPTASQYPGGGVAPLGTRFNRAILYKKATAKPANPTADWWDVSGAGYVANLNGWHRTHEDADGETGATGSIWRAIDTVLISSNGNKTYEGWDVQAEFGVEYRADASGAWRSNYMAGDLWMGFRRSDGTRDEVLINPPEDKWALIAQGKPFNTGGGGFMDFGATKNLNLYDRLRFDWQPFGLFVNGAMSNIGQVRSTYLHKPADGWRSNTARKATDADTDSVASFQWHFEADNVGNMMFLEGGVFGNTILSAPVTRGVDAFGNQLPMEAGSGLAAFVGSDADNPHMVQSLDCYRFADGMYYQRFHLKIYGEIE